MNASIRDIQARISITFLDPLYAQSVSIESDDTEPDSSVDELIDGEGYTTYNWFAFGNNKLDGTYHFPANLY